MDTKTKRIIWCLLGVIIIGLGCALFKQSACGNDAFTALNITLSEKTGISLGTMTVIMNCIYLIAPLIWGRKYINIGTILADSGGDRDLTWHFALSDRRSRRGPV